MWKACYDAIETVVQLWLSGWWPLLRNLLLMRNHFLAPLYRLTIFKSLIQTLKQMIQLRSKLILNHVLYHNHHSRDAMSEVWGQWMIKTKDWPHCIATLPDYYLIIIISQLIENLIEKPFWLRFEWTSQMRGKISILWIQHFFWVMMILTNEPKFSALCIRLVHKKNFFCSHFESF